MEQASMSVDVSLYHKDLLLSLWFLNELEHELPLKIKHSSVCVYAHAHVHLEDRDISKSKIALEPLQKVV